MPQAGATEVVEVDLIQKVHEVLGQAFEVAFGKAALAATLKKFQPVVEIL